MTETDKVFIVTDTNSGINPEEAKKLGIGLIPMPFTIDGYEYYEGENISSDIFSKLIREGRDIKTSQPPVAKLISLFEEGLRQYDAIVYIPMSGALSSSCMTAKCLASSFNGKVQVVDNHRISCTQKQSVLEARYLAGHGYTAEEIKDILEKHKDEASIYISPENLQFLKEGGRMEDPNAVCSSLLDIRPVMEIRGGRLELLTKARGIKAAEKKILDAIDYDMSHKFFGKDVIIKGAYSGSEDIKRSWYRILSDRYPAYIISVDHLPLSICCHIGEGAVAAVCMQKSEEAPFTRYEI